MIDAPIVNAATHLVEMARRWPHRAAVLFPEARDRRGRVAYTQLSFQQLHDDSSRMARFLQSVGLSRGMRTALMMPPSLDFFTVTFALFKMGAVPVLIDPGMGIRNLGRCLGDAAPEAFIGVPKAHLARKLLGWARGSLRITVTTGKGFAQYALPRTGTEPPAEFSFSQAPTTAEETAAILFTSGSTGVAKGVVYTHRTFAAQIELLRTEYDIRPGETDLCTFPLFALFAPALGMTAVIPEMDPTRPALVDPRKILRAVSQFGVSNMFGSPALLNRVGRFMEANPVDLPSLHRVISAGAPVPAGVIERIARALRSGAQLHTPYGATEALPVASIGSDELLRSTRFATDRGCGVCVGRPVEPVQVRILATTDQPVPQWDDALCLPPGQIGEITVSGPIVSTTYFNRPEANTLAKIQDSRTGTTWHRMGDLGYLDNSGRLWFCGRKSHRVVTPGGTLHSVPCEAVFDLHPQVYRTALVGVPTKAGVRPVLCVEEEPKAPGDKQGPRWNVLESELVQIAGQHRHTRSIQTFLRHPAFPVDVRHNAKIFREKLALWATRKLAGCNWCASMPAVEPPPVFDELAASVSSVCA